MLPLVCLQYTTEDTLCTLHLVHILWSEDNIACISANFQVVCGHAVISGGLQ